ncbi:MAG: ATP-binding cassette domain-containing protein [bacterium]|nr:ATP-binding cassette domain-containing protein [bacterium]
MANDKRFELKGVSKFYFNTKWSGKKKRITAPCLFDLDIYDGEICALTGRSGCGKSTLAHLVAGLDTYDQGIILYKGTPFNTRPDDSTGKHSRYRRFFQKNEVLPHAPAGQGNCTMLEPSSPKRASLTHRFNPFAKGRAVRRFWKTFRQENRIIFQDTLQSVNPCFTVAQIIAEPMAIAGKEEKEIKEKIGGLLDILELPPGVLKKRPARLSGGELQRVVLARTLLPQPEFVILDEPFAFLDNILAERLCRHFKRVFRTMEVGALFISHDSQRVSLMADKVTEMH